MIFPQKPADPLPVYSATLSDDASRMVLRGRYHDEAKAWLPCLPGARWVPTKLCWTVDATPAAAWRLLGHAPFRVEAEAAVLALSARFLPAPGPLPTSQPELRTRDSWRHQIDPYHFAMAREGSLAAMWMGTGKSKVAVDLNVNRRAMRTLVVCPVSVMGVWRREFGKFAAEPVDVLVLDAPSWSVAKKAEKAAEHVKRCGLLGKPCAVVVNYESAWRSPFAEWCLGQSWCMSIADEIHRAKGHSTRQGKFMGEVGRVAGFRLGLSGTPMAHSPLDLFGVARFIDRGIFGTSWHHFRNRYARCNELFPNQVDEWLNQDELRERLSLFAIHVGEEVLDLPPVQHMERHVKLDPATRRVYREFEKEMIAEVGAGVLTADNGLVKLLRLQQMTSGFVGGVEVGEEKEEVSLGTEKRDVLGDLLLDLPDREPVVVCCRFKRDLQAVRELAEILGRRYGEVSGSRRDLTPNGEMPDDVDLFGVQIHSGGVGIDLTRACYAVLYSVGFSLDDFLQFAARLHRPGQKRPVRFYHLLAEDSVDHAVYAALRARHNVIESVLSVLKGGGNVEVSS